MTFQELNAMLRRIESHASGDDDAISELDVAVVIRDLISKKTRIADLESQLSMERAAAEGLLETIAYERARNRSLAIPGYP